MRHAFPFIKELLRITRVLIHCVWPSGINQPQWIKAAGDSFWLLFKEEKKKNVNWLSHSEMKQAAPGGGSFRSQENLSSSGYAFGRSGPCKHQHSDGNRQPSRILPRLRFMPI